LSLSNHTQYQALEDNSQGGYGQYNPYGAQQNPYAQQQQQQQPYGYGGGYEQSGAAEQGNGGYGESNSNNLQCPPK
jgi:syntaxin 1B/2/3